MEKIQLAPGEYGKFCNWGDDIFLEEKCFTHLYPYGTGGFLSTNITEKILTKGLQHMSVKE